MPLSDTASLQPASGKRFPVSSIHDFLKTPQYVALVCLLALVSNVLALEPVIYGIYTALVVYICIWGKDTLPIMPVFACCYIAPSGGNNPGRNEASVFSGAGGVYIAVLGAVIGAACLYRVIRDRKQFAGRKYRLLAGMLVLSAAYLLGGIGIPGYGEKAPRNLLFAFLQGASVWVLYLLFSGTVDWKNVRRDYFAWIGFCLGGVLVCQILWIYISGGVIENGVIRRDRIFTGWGIHNNLGAMLAMMIPFAFYLATKYRKGWLGTVVGSLYLLGVFLSCSRNAILTGCAIYFMGIVLMLYYARNRKGNTVAALICISVASMLVIVFNGKILRLFSDILSMGFDPNSRDSIYAQGMEMFKQYPVFGCSFFSPGYEPWGWSTVEAFSGFFPPRWHNTFVQMLASCGVVGMAAYLLHRVQTFVMLLHRHNKEKLFIGCSVLVLLICSLFDCHFFNIGPTLFYSMALAFAENCHEAE